ncbi:Dual specificity protein kinase Ttk like protein [Argiope bruennichi]|uniref:Dual specificity protein kinase Ttk like protein n=2 Tax=Argiope bruennichi TaxID=94029 RepID=A0A8T0E1N7_ARGBR|nr:Dual specificity protein kinase Ttk like protein [Argiope bruennichi]
MPTYSHKSNEAIETNFKSAVTHPSVRARNIDDLFKRIRSGNDVLCRLPTRLDPSVEFSEDEDEDEPVEESGNENKEPEVEKTPEFRPRTHELLSKFEQFSTSSKKNQIAPPNFNPFNQQYYSVQKPNNIQRNRLSMQNFMPQSEYKIRKPNALAERQPKIKMDLMSQPEFKVPLEKPLASNMPLKKTSPLTDDIIEVNRKSYSVLSLLGSGGSCKVYSVFDLEKKSLVAIKCVDLKNTDPSIREGYKKEIEYLQKLQHSSRVIKMYDYEYRKNELFIVLERGEVDFAKYISNEAKLKRLSPLMIKFYWAQMLEAVADIHKYGIVHSDLKPANFLLVAGNLKLIDFGIATSVPDDKTSTFRDTQVGTLNYMSPEAITQMSDNEKIRFKVGVKSDVWSLGCILYNLVYGVTPFHNFKTLMQKINAITNPNYEIEFRPLPDKLIVDVLKKCLKRNPKERASVEELLNHPYLEEESNPKEADFTKSNDLNNVMAQMQILTPRRMSYLSKVVKELSEKK